jgi:hypothetical protein
MRRFVIMRSCRTGDRSSRGFAWIYLGLSIGNVWHTCFVAVAMSCTKFDTRPILAVARPSPHPLPASGARERMFYAHALHPFEGKGLYIIPSPPADECRHAPTGRERVRVRGKSAERQPISHLFLSTKSPGETAAGSTRKPAASFAWSRRALFRRSRHHLTRPRAEPDRRRRGWCRDRRAADRSTRC